MTDSDKIQTLPLPFLERMKEMLGDDYDAFLESYENPRTYGLRVNTAKLSCQDFQELSPFPIRPIPWISTGYFYDEESRPARCPYYQAGLYYLQEPSAMTPASRLAIEPGDFVLDLCAAPGGKATALGAALNDTGFLLANDISTSRARALLRNLELFGMKNMLVTDEKPAKLAQRFPAFFNKILLDAPCSGEGMFRKEEALARIASYGVADIMQERDFAANLKAREDLYETLGPISCFVGVGGNITTIGLEEDKMKAGVMVPYTVTSVRSDDGLLQYYNAHGLPVLHLLNIKQLAAQYGLPFDPETIVPPGQSALYYHTVYPHFPALAGVLGAVCILVFAFKRRFMSEDR